MTEKLKPCPFCGNEIVIIPAHFESQWCVNVPSIICEKCHQTYEGSDIMQIGKSEAWNEEFATDLLVKWWNTRPAEDALKAEVEELRYIVEQFKLWTAEDGCPHFRYPEFPCWLEEQHPGEDEEFYCDSLDEASRGCWVEYYRWKYRQKLNSATPEKGGEDE